MLRPLGPVDFHFSIGRSMTLHVMKFKYSNTILATIGIEVLEAQNLMNSVVPIRKSFYVLMI